MRASFAAKLLAALIAIALAEPVSMAAGGDKKSWQNLQQLSAGREIEVTKNNGGAVRGTFVSFTDQSITLRGKQQDVTVTKTDVSRIGLLPAGARRHGGLIGAGIGAGAGAGVGAAIAERVAGDFSNLRPAIIGVSAGIGALVGAGIGFAFSSRHTTVYTAK